LEYFEIGRETMMGVGTTSKLQGKKYLNLCK